MISKKEREANHIAFQIYLLELEDYEMWEAGYPIRSLCRASLRERINMLREEAESKGYNIHSRPIVR